MAGSRSWLAGRRARSRSRSLGLLLAVALAALGIMMWTGLRQARQDAAAEAARWLVRLERTDVAAFSLDEVGGPELRLQRAGAGWRLTRPLAGVAEASTAETQVAQMARMLGRPVTSRPNSDELRRYGLLPPHGRLQLELRDGTRRTLMVGGKNPFDGSTYVRDEHGAVFATVAPVHAWIARGADAFRETRLLGAQLADVRSVWIETPSGRCSLVRATGGGWARSDSGSGTVSPAAHEAVSLLAAVRVQGFVRREDSGDAYGLNSPRLRLGIELADGTTRLLTLGAAATGRRATGPQAYYAQRDGSASDVGLLIDAIVPKLEQAFAGLCLG